MTGAILALRIVGTLGLLAAAVPAFRLWYRTRGDAGSFVFLVVAVAAVSGAVMISLLSVTTGQSRASVLADLGAVTAFAYGVAYLLVRLDTETR